MPWWVQLKESQQREQALSADLEAAKKAQQEAQQQLQQAQSQVQAARDAPMATPSPSHRSMENGTSPQEWVLAYMPYLSPWHMCLQLACALSAAAEPSLFAYRDRSWLESQSPIGLTVCIDCVFLVCVPLT